MRKIIALEEFAQLVTCLYIFFTMPNHFGVTTFIIVFFSPDAFAIGFLVNNQLGTILYNLSHHKFVALALVAIGFFIQNGILIQVGVVVYAHSCFDRSIGYGLKFMGNPSKTHLGFIGKEKSKNLPDTF